MQRGNLLSIFGKPPHQRAADEPGGAGHETMLGAKFGRHAGLEFSPV